ncbi:MAG: M23 family metallopeptidase [Pseudomonadota bacterium]
MRRCLILLLGIGLTACASRTPQVLYPSEYPQPDPSGIRTTGLMRAVPPQGPFQPNAELFVCRMTVSNRPATNANDMMLDFSPIVVSKGVVLASVPVNDACLSSGFGPRNGRMHEGIDLSSNPAGTVYSAAPGIILEVSDVSGYGNQVLIDHGGGVYTRYAHFESFAPALAPGQVVGFGEPLGTMGQTGNATGIHLHYEVLNGDYNTPKKSWGLKAYDPLDLPAWAGLDTGS